MSTKQAKQAANNRWNKKTYDAITFRMKKGEKELIDEHIKITGESLNAFVIRAIMTQLEIDKQSEGISTVQQETSTDIKIESTDNETPSE